MSAIGAFAVGFFAHRPKDMIFGHYGDRIGRKTMLIISLILMGGAKVLIALLPTYESIGIWLIATYTVVLAIITIVSTYLALETFQEEISAEHPDERWLILGEPK